MKQGYDQIWGGGRDEKDVEGEGRGRREEGVSCRQTAKQQQQQVKRTKDERRKRCED